MLFSIIVPIYNAGKYLIQCVESILHQSFTDFELILLDDGSTDESSEICDDFKSDKRIKVFHKKNEGLVATRKFGSTIAQGKYIISIDADDYIETNYLKKISSVIYETNADFVTWGWTYLNDDLVAGTENHQCQEGYYQTNKYENIKNEFLYSESTGGINSGSLLPSVWCKAIKRELYIEAQAKVPNEISKGEDTLLTIFLLNIAKNIYILNYNGYFYRLSKGSMIGMINPNDFLLLKKFYEQLNNAFGPLKDSYKKQINMCIFNRFFPLLKNYVKHSKNYNDFRFLITDRLHYDINDVLSLKQIRSKNLKDKIKIFVCKYNSSFISYYILKYLIKS